VAIPEADLELIELWWRAWVPEHVRIRSGSRPTQRTHIPTVKVHLPWVGVGEHPPFPIENPLRVVGEALVALLAGPQHQVPCVQPIDGHLPVIDEVDLTFALASMMPPLVVSRGPPPWAAA
jgi:hypothetical protein